MWRSQLLACTALLEWPGHEGPPKLSLSFTDSHRPLLLPAPKFKPASSHLPLPHKCSEGLRRPAAQLPFDLGVIC